MIPQGSLSILAQTHDTVGVDFLAAFSCCEHPVPPDPKGATLGLNVVTEVAVIFVKHLYPTINFYLSKNGLQK